MQKKQYKTKFLHIRSSFYQKVLTLFGITGSLFIFQACYGTPQDPDKNMLISFEGHVRSEDLMESIPDIEVSLLTKDKYDSYRTFTDENGKFSFDISSEVPDKSFDISIKDIDDENNGLYQPEKAKISVNRYNKSFKFLLKRKI